MSEISETEIKSMTKLQNYMRGYEDGKSDVIDKIKAEILLRDKNVKDVRTDGHCFFTADEIFEIIDKHIEKGANE